VRHANPHDEQQREDQHFLSIQDRRHIIIITTTTIIMMYMGDMAGLPSHPEMVIISFILLW
jgi:hypothetical protein